MKYFKSFVVLCLCCLFLIPDRVFADTPTYSVIDDCFIYITYTQGANTNYGRIHADSSVNAFLYGTDGGTYFNGYVYLVSDTSFRYWWSSGSTSQTCPAEYNDTSYSATVNNTSFYYAVFSINKSNVTNLYLPVNSNAPVSGNDKIAHYYVYGEGAVAPLPPTPPPPSYGELMDVKFSTSIAGNGSAAVNNIDHIIWNPEMDSNGVTFDGTERVQIKAIAGNYTDSSRNGLLGLGVTDFDYNSGSEHMLAEYPATRGYYDVSWSHVIQQLNAGSISDFLNIRKNDDVWLKSGWIYQIRLVAGEYESQWITIYNGTSSGVENSLTIENSTELNMTLVNTIQQINNLNQTVTNWEIDNTTINMENQDGTETTDKPWWAYLLEALVSLLNGILGFLGNLIGDLIDAIVSLFQPSEFTINNFNEYKLELKQNSGIFGQAIDFINTLKNTFLGVQYQDPVLHWSGISFGETVFIPAADYNLNDYVTMWGLGDFRTMAYLCSDGFIYFSLLILIVHKINEVLKK